MTPTPTSPLVEYLPYLLPLGPLITILFVFVVYLNLRRDLQPIVVSVVGGVAKQAQTNAVACALAFGFGLSASLEALSDQATVLHWVVVAALCKVLNPFIVAVLAYATQNGFVKRDGTPLSQPSTIAVPVNVTPVEVPAPAPIPVSPSQP